MVFIAYILSAVYLAMRLRNPDGLALFFPFFICILISIALPFFWEIRELQSIRHEDK